MQLPLPVPIPNSPCKTDVNGNKVTIEFKDGVLIFSSPNFTKKSLKSFIDNTKPVLEALNKTKLGREVLSYLINSKYGFNVEDLGSKEKSKSNSLIDYGEAEEAQYQENDGKFFTITPTFDKIESKISPEEFYAEVINLEKGHLNEITGKLDLDAEILLQGDASEYVKVYTPLLNQAVRDRLRFRQEELNGEGLNKSLFYPVTDTNDKFDLKDKPSKIKFDKDNEDLFKIYGNIDDPNHPDTNNKDAAKPKR